jgi:hypothetical protein
MAEYRYLGPMLAMLAVTAIAAAVLLLSNGGGGGDQPRQVSADDYRKHLVTTLADVKLDSNPADGSALRELAGEMRDAAGQLDDVVPPPDAAPAHGRLVAGLEEYAGQLDSLADSGRGGAVQFQQQLAQTGVPGRAWVAAFNELAAKGYATWTPR